MKINKRNYLNWLSALCALLFIVGLKVFLWSSSTSQLMENELLLCIISGECNEQVTEGPFYKAHRLQKLNDKNANPHMIKLAPKLLNLPEALALLNDISQHMNFIDIDVQRTKNKGVCHLRHAKKHIHLRYYFTRVSDQLYTIDSISGIHTLPLGCEI